MELPKVLIEILNFFKFLWALFTVDSPKPLRLVNNPLSSKPFRLLHLPSLAHDVVFSEMSTTDLYHLSKCSTRSRYAVRMFARRQKYDFSITADKSHYSLRIAKYFEGGFFHSDLRPMEIRKPLAEDSCITYSEDVWVETKKEILYFFDVFTKKVNSLEFYDITIITKMTEFLKEKTVLPVDLAVYGIREIDDEMYKYVLKQFKDAKTLSIDASPSADFRFADMEPFTGDFISIKDADWLTVDNLTRCFMNFKKIQLWTSSRRYLNVHVFNQFLNAWRNGLKVGKLEFMWECANFDLQSIFKNVPKTEVTRVELKYCTQVFGDGKCFLIRQEESGVEALVYFNASFHRLYFTTDFRLLRDDEFN